MTIESSLERIADALEIIAGKAGGAPSESPAEPAAAKASTPAKSEKKSSTASPKKEASAPSDVSRKDVLAALKALDSNAGRQILADHGASKLSDLDEEKYADVLAAAQAAAEE
jgi:hypothetical protein